MALFGSVACGIGALLVLDRRDRKGDVAGDGLLLVALLFFDLGIPFVAAATVEIALSRDRWRRAFVVAVPTFLWLLWYGGWGHNAHTFISVHNFANAPELRARRARLQPRHAGRARGRRSATTRRVPLDWGQPLLILVVGLAAWRVYAPGAPAGPAARLPRPPPRLLGPDGAQRQSAGPADGRALPVPGHRPARARSRRAAAGGEGGSLGDRGRARRVRRRRRHQRRPAQTDGRRARRDRAAAARRARGAGAHARTGLTGLQADRSKTPASTTSGSWTRARTSRRSTRTGRPPTRPPSWPRGPRRGGSPPTWSSRRPSASG